MKAKYTLILLVLVVGLLAYIRYYETEQKGTKEASETGKYVAKFNMDDVTGMAIKVRETTVRFKKEGSTWMITEPVADRADSVAVNGILTAYEGLSKEQSIPLSNNKEEAKAALKEFGLTSPKLQIDLEGKDLPKTLELGNDTAVEGKLYARIDGSSEVAVIRSDFREQISKTPDDFRDHRLSDASTDRVDKLVVKTAAGEIELRKEKDAWRLVRPIEARADGGKVGNLINQIVNARIDSFVSKDTSDLNAYGLSDPRGAVSFSAEGDPAMSVLEFGPATAEKSELIYARYAKRGSIYMLPKEMESILELKPNDLRDRNLMRLDPDVVDRITIDSTSGGKVVLVRNKEEWSVRPGGDEKKALDGNKNSIMAMVNRLRNQQVKEFSADTASDLAQYGLDRPLNRVTFSSYATENVPEAGAGEHPILTLLLGKVDGDKLYAKLKDEPFVVAVDPAMIGEVNRHALAWKNPVVNSFKADEITSVEISKGESKAWKVEKDPAGKWKLTAGGGEINETNVLSILNTLANLKAVEWVGPTSPEYALEAPRLSVTYTLGEKKETIRVGAATPQGATYASKGQEVFLLGSADYGSLDLSVATEPNPDGAAPAGTPQSSATPAK